MNEEHEPDSKQIGPYRIKRLLGKGGMGMVYLAEDPQTQTEVAIKVLLPHIADDTHLLNRFAREIEVLSKFHHPNIIQILAMGQEGETRYFVMEYVRGKDIGVMIAEQGPISWPIVLDYAMQICRGLRNAHDYGVVHRDLKPVNFLVDEQNTVKIADFGIARPWGDDGQTQAGALMGTLAFMSPEQAAGKPVTNASDIYSLGASLYEMLTGCPPFKSPSIPGMLQLIVNEPVVPLRVRNPDIPVEFDKLICALMEKKAENRPRSAYNVECKLKDVTEFGEGRLFRKAESGSRSDNSENEIADDFEQRNPDDDPTIHQAETDLEVRDLKNRQPGPDSVTRVTGLAENDLANFDSQVPEKYLNDENESKTDQLTNDTSRTQDYGPTRNESCDAPESEFRLRPILDSNAASDEPGIAESAVEKPPSDPKSSGTFRVPVKQPKPVEWTTQRKILDTQTIVLFVALFVVVALAIWGKSVWRAIGFSGEEVVSAGDDISLPHSPIPVTAEYGNSFNHVTNFYLTNHTSHPVQSVKMLVQYVGEDHEVLASTVVQTSTLGETGKEILAILGPNEMRKIVEPPPDDVAASVGFGRIEEPQGTHNVMIVVQQVTFLDNSTWSPPEEPPEEPEPPVE